MNLPVIDGVHTYSVWMAATYKQFGKIWNACCQTGKIDDQSNVFERTKWLYCYTFFEQGVKIYLQAKSGSFYNLNVQIEPCRVLGESDPTALFQLDKKRYKELVGRVDKLLKKMQFPRSVDTMKIHRCDLTVNVRFSTQEELSEYLRVFKKSCIIPHYRRDYFRKNEQKAHDFNAANSHSFRVSCKSASFLIYDKIAQLEMIDRMNEALLDKHVLRFEAELGRAALKKHLGKNAMETNYKILHTAARNCTNIVQWYLERLQPQCKRYLRYEDAVQMIEKAKMSAKMRERMLFLLRKASDRESLSTALVDLYFRFGMGKHQINTLLKKFRKLGISPITLRNSSSYSALPALVLTRQESRKP